MKKKLFLISSYLLCSIVAFSQSQTSVFQPGPSLGEDAFVTSYPGDENSNFGTNQDIAAVSWTSGNAFNSRSYFKFDLSSIPATATVQSATLNLTFNPNSGHAQGNQGDNGCFIRQVTGAWTEFAITWNNQPANSAVNQAVLAQSTSASQSYPNIDVTLLVQPMVANAATNHGFVMMLQTEATYRSMVFCSSDHADNAKRPELTVVWLDTTITDSVDCIDYNLDQETGKDAWVTSYPGNENNNYGNSVDIAAVAWTASGLSFISRSYFQYDFSAIPANAIVTSADLSLYANPTSGHAQGHSSQTGSNASVIRKVTSSWVESTITWNNQPTSTNINEVQLAQSSNSLQDYPNIDISGLVQDAVASPSSNFGFQYSLQTEAQFRSMVFASTDHPDTLLRPKLRVCYDVPTELAPPVASLASLTVFPNPSHTTMALAIKGWNPGTIKVSLLGLDGGSLWVGTFELGTKEPLLLDCMAQFTAGTYLVRVENQHSESMQAIVVKQ